MKPPRLRGEIERRLLVNYRIDPVVAARDLPAPFRPQLRNGFAVAGICLIRLGSVRPAGLPGAWGLRSENAAHRFAVEWDDVRLGPQSGVYIPRRDSDSLINVALGGRVFPGEHHLARFDVQENDTAMHVDFEARDGSARVAVDVVIDGKPGPSALFEDLDAASRFFKAGSLGYSETSTRGTFDGMRLITTAWQVSQASVTRARSSFFDDPRLFPPGSAVLDGAVAMRHVAVDWQGIPRLSARPETVAG